MASRAVEAAARIQAALQNGGYEVSRHASSMIVLYRGRLLATLHVHPDKCRLNLYRPWLHANREAVPGLRRLVASLCPGPVEERETPAWQA